MAKGPEVRLDLGREVGAGLDAAAVDDAERLREEGGGEVDGVTEGDLYGLVGGLHHPPSIPLSPEFGDAPPRTRPMKGVVALTGVLGEGGGGPDSGHRLLPLVKRRPRPERPGYGVSVSSASGVRISSTGFLVASSSVVLVPPSVGAIRQTAPVSGGNS